MNASTKTYQPHGKHLIAGEWVETTEKFKSEDAFLSYGFSTRKSRATFLNTIADEFENRGEEITAIGTLETGLPAARLEGERGRTTAQLRLFAEHILKGDYLDYRHDNALPNRAPLPRPDLRMIQRPIGPVAVFGASNFPLAFSTAGGDTAAALAAGCPVIVKGHSAHPGTGEIVAEAIHAAIVKCNIHSGVFSLIQGGNRTVGQSLVQDPYIKAVGFTGSLGGGRALFDLCAARPEPIPFFGELGSINPMFLLPSALEEKNGALGKNWAASLIMGAGQFCTNPGVSVIIDGSAADKFVEQTRIALEEVAPQTMLTIGIANAYHDGREKISSVNGVREVLSISCQAREASPTLYETSGKTWLNSEALEEEVFGPLGMVVRAKDENEMLQIAQSLRGQLTGTIHMTDDDAGLARNLLPIIERKVGRVLVNGFPTGVEVCDSMVHGGG